MMTYEEMLMRLYWKLWTSAEFESDFQADWKALYTELQKGNHYQDTTVLKIAFQYLQDWEREH